VARLLKWLVDRKITPHVPVWDKSARHHGFLLSGGSAAAGADTSQQPLLTPPQHA
jgi:hypothetical protein